MKIADIAQLDSRFFLKSEFEPVTNDWPAVSFTKYAVGRKLRDQYRPAIDFIVYVGTSNPETTKEPKHRQRLLSVARIDPGQIVETRELVPPAVWEASQIEYGERWQFSFPILKAWDVVALPWASEVTASSYRALGFIENCGNMVQVGDGERSAILALDTSDVSLNLQPVATRRAAIRKYIDAPELLKREIYRLADLICNRVDLSGTTSIRRNPERNAPPPTALQELLFKQHQEQQGRCGLCGGPMVLPAPNKLLQMSTDRIDSLNPSYKEGAVLITHLSCNLAKSDASMEVFEAWLDVASRREETSAVPDSQC